MQIDKFFEQDYHLSMSSNLNTTFQSRKLAFTYLIFGLFGGTLGWLLGEIQMDDEEGTRWFRDNLHVGTGIVFALVLLGIGIFIIGADAYGENNFQKFLFNLRSAAPVFIIGGFLGGIFGQSIYESMLTQGDIIAAMESCEYQGKDPFVCTEVDNVYRPARAIAWLVAGALGGVGVGVTFKSKRRVQNGLIGGAAGGLLGGLLFDSVDNVISGAGGTTSRFFGFLILGALIAGCIALVNVMRTQMWLTVLTGEMSNKQFLIYDDETLVGTARNIPITILGDAAISEHHIRITNSGNVTSFTTLNNASPIMLNGNAVTSGNIKDGDILIIGNTEISVGEKTSSTSSQPLQNQQNFPVSGERERPNIYKDTNETTAQTGSPERKIAPPPKAPTARPTIQMKPKE